MPTKKPPVKPDPDCQRCAGKGWIRALNGWPVTCLCLERSERAKPRPNAIRRVTAAILGRRPFGLPDEP